MFMNKMFEICAQFEIAIAIAINFFIQLILGLILQEESRSIGNNQFTI